MKAFLKNYRQSPRKVRLVADLIKGRNVNQAVIELNSLPKRASLPIKKLLSSAIANAKITGVNIDNLFIKELTVNKGIVMKRMMPRAMGRGARINKRTSHINIVLAEKIEKVKKTKNKIIKADKKKEIIKKNSVSKKINKTKK